MNLFALMSAWIIKNQRNSKSKNIWIGKILGEALILFIYLFFCLLHNAMPVCISKKNAILRSIFFFLGSHFVRYFCYLFLASVYLCLFLSLWFLFTFILCSFVCGLRCGLCTVNNALENQLNCVADKMKVEDELSSKEWTWNVNAHNHCRREFDCK